MLFRSRRHAEGLDLQHSTDQLEEVYREAIEQHKAKRKAAAQ